MSAGATIDPSVATNGLGERATPLLRLLERAERNNPDLYGHGDAVAEYCIAVARRLGLSEEDAEALYFAGRLHDIGKAGIEESVLLKPGPLTREEWDRVRLHPEIGANLHAACGLGMIAGWVLAHHERPDGRGYPQGLSGDEIPIPARILAAADALDAMLTDRVYRRALSGSAASAELRARAGEQFDAEVVDALLAVA